MTRFRLRNGTFVLIRPIRATDKDLLAAGHARLSEETIRRRFLAAKPRLTSTDLRYLTEVDGHNHVAFVAVLEDAPEQMVAVGRFVRLAGEPEAAEFAIVIADALQGQGLGSHLGELLADAARERGVRRFTATTLSDNVVIRRVFGSISRRLVAERSQGATRELVAELAA